MKRNLKITVRDQQKMDRYSQTEPRNKNFVPQIMDSHGNIVS